MSSPEMNIKIARGMDGTVEVHNIAGGAEFVIYSAI